MRAFRECSHENIHQRNCALNNKQSIGVVNITSTTKSLACPSGFALGHTRSHLIMVGSRQHKMQGQPSFWRPVCASARAILIRANQHQHNFNSALGMNGNTARCVQGQQAFSGHGCKIHHITVHLNWKETKKYTQEIPNSSPKTNC